MSKGFTLVELLAILAILGAVILVSVPSIVTSNKKSQENNYTQKMFEKMQDTPQSRKIYNFVNDYIERRLSNEKE